MPNEHAFWEEARKLMETGELPEKVSMQLIWAAVAATYTRLDGVAALAEANDKKVSRLDWAARIIGAALVALAFKVVFGA